MSSKINSIYYRLKPLIPRRLQLWLRRQVVVNQRARYTDVWPILESAASRPPEWPGWPENKKFSVVLTHDVEKAGGQKKVRKLAELERELGYRSSFNFVPERYAVSAEVRQYLTEAGFEVGVHGLNHDGKLFQSKAIWQERVPKINRYIADWQVAGFRAPAMHHNLDWIHDLNIEYDASTFDTDPFEPQSDGVATIFPFWHEKNGTGYVELPYTLAQDFTPFILMRERNIDFWTRKVDWIAEQGGMVLVNTHPDYMCFNGKPGYEEFPAGYYADLLCYIRDNYADQYWHALPKEVAQHCKPLRPG
jgi:peptidoglycan/xylan/chitin deacetylase (PgdA/CDA1 family)